MLVGPIDSRFGVRNRDMELRNSRIGARRPGPPKGGRQVLVDQQPGMSQQEIEGQRGLGRGRKSKLLKYVGLSVGDCIDKAVSEWHQEAPTVHQSASFITTPR